jgi:hypothetical protein
MNLMKEEELNMKHRIDNVIYIYGNKHKETTNHNTNLDNRVRHKIAYVFGPLSRWVMLSYFSSNLQKYIIKVKNGLQNDLAMLC